MRSISFLACFLSFLLLTSCAEISSPTRRSSFHIPESAQTEVNKPLLIEVSRDISVGTYYAFMDELVSYFDTLLPYPITEHLIVRTNPWIIDSLAATDYYKRMERGIFTYDPQSVQVFGEGTRLRIPDSSEVDSILEYQGLVYLDINIPEFKLRIWHYDSLLYTFPVRVGQNTSKFLAVSKANVDLRTQVGSGCIVRLNRNPDFVNPTNGKEYKVTRRDDERVTLMPRIPWIEPELNGVRYGQLIHPTTNPNTLGKAYSNGCIGAKEGDMWIIYYYASMGTSVNVRYDREVVDEEGKKVILKDIYPGFEEEIKKQKWKFRREVCVCSDVN